MPDAHWLFGYGSLIWRPDFAYVEAQPAHLPGWERRFWQGSHDHRGTPDQPGRVVTLVEGGGCVGMAYRIDGDAKGEIIERLDHREKNGYEQRNVRIDLTDGRHVEGLIYFAAPGNFAYLGDAPLDQIATQVAASRGPSGWNYDYLYELAAALRNLGAHDHHVFELEAPVRQLRAT